MQTLDIGPLVPLNESQSVSADEVAKRTGLHLRTVQRYARLGIIPGAFQPGGKGSQWRFKRKTLEEWWAKLGK